MLENLSKNIAKYCFGFFIFLYAAANILVTVRQYNVGENIANYYFGISFLNIIIVGILLLLIVFVLRQQKIKINNKYLLGTFIFACIIVGLYWIFSNYPYLVEIAKTGKPVVMSTGMCELQEIDEAIGVLKNNGTSDITLLHCNTQYPTPYEDVNLRAMKH